MQDPTPLEAILNNAIDAIITIDSSGIVESVNPATERMFGYAPHEVIGHNITLLMPSPFREEHDQYIANYLSSRIPKIIGIGREVVGRRKDGSTFPMHLAVSEFEDEGKKLFTGIVRDISDLKAAEGKLREANETLEARVRERTAELEATQAQLVQQEKLATLGQVAGGIAHEIRNPLNAVKTSVYYLAHAKRPTPAKTAEHLERIDRQVTMIDNVVTALSDVAKLPDPSLEPLSVLDLVRPIAKSVTLPPAINVSVAIPDDLPPIEADQDQFTIVLRNLIRNARDAMPNGGTITISAERNDDELRLIVADEGEGIQPDQLEKIMEPFYSTKARGMGLGLAISKAIIERNRGRIEVTSKLGVGSRFALLMRVSEAKHD